MSIEIKKKPLKRRTISLEEKLQILNRLENGERCSSVAKSLNLNEATVRTIKQSENKIRQNLTEGSSMFVKRSSRTRNIDIIRMEHALVMWIEDCLDKTKPLNGRLIKEKALEIYQSLSTDQPHSTKLFSASKGWYEKFKKRYLFNSSNSKLQEVSAKMETNNDFAMEIVDTIKTEQYPNDDDDDDNDNDDENFSSNETISTQDYSRTINEEAFMISTSLGRDKQERITNLTFEDIKTGIELAEKLEFHFIQKDPSVVRSRKFKRELQNCLAPYLEVLEALQTNR